MAKDAIYTYKKEVRTYVDLAHGVDVLIEKTEKERKGSYSTAMSALMLTAFTFEAYLNHLGEKELKLWKEPERIGVMDKYKKICKKLNHPRDFTKRPNKTLNTLFTFRDATAHGRTRMLSRAKKVSSKSNLFDLTPKTFIQEFATLKNTKQAKEDITKIIVELNIAARLGNKPFIHPVGSSSLSLKPPN